MNFKHNNTTLNMYTTKLLEHVIGKRGMYTFKFRIFGWTFGPNMHVHRFVQLWSLMKNVSYQIEVIKIVINKS